MHEREDDLRRFLKRGTAEDRLPSIEEIQQALACADDAAPGVLDYMRLHPELVRRIRVIGLPDLWRDPEHGDG